MAGARHGRGWGWRVSLSTYQHLLLPPVSGAPYCGPATALQRARNETGGQHCSGDGGRCPVHFAAVRRPCLALHGTVLRCQPAAQAVLDWQLRAPCRQVRTRAGRGQLLPVAALHSFYFQSLACAAVLSHTSSNWSAMPDLHFRKMSLLRSHGYK